MLTSNVSCMLGSAGAYISIAKIANSSIANTHTKKLRGSSHFCDRLSENDISEPCCMNVLLTPDAPLQQKS